MNINYIYLYNENTVPLSIHHYFSILSHEVIYKFPIKFWTNDVNRLSIEPYFTKLKDKVSDIEIIDIRELDDKLEFKIDTPYMSHLADFYKFNIMYLYGGIYSDVDSIAIKQLPGNYLFSELPTYCAEKYNGVNCALCSGFFIANKHSKFLGKVISEYRDYDATKELPNTDMWAYHAVTVPWKLYLENKNLINLLSSDAFQSFYCDRESLGRIYFLDRFNEIPLDAYEFHLWENRSRDFFKSIDRRYFIESNSTYAKLIRKVIPNEFI